MSQEWPVWFSIADCEAADQHTRVFIEKAFEHREQCPVCQAKSPCEELHVLTDEVAGEVKKIGDEAFARYTAAIEAKYSHRDYWSDR